MPSPAGGDVLTLASDASLARGQDYADRGLVTDLHGVGDAIEATVRGTNDYTVRLDPGGASCDCPHAWDGHICKHMVAVALAAGSAPVPRTESAATLQPAVTSEDVDALRSEVDAVLRTRRSLDYHRAMDYAVAAEGLLAALQGAASGPAAGEVVPVVERALRHVVSAILRADDSSGLIGDLVVSLMDAHAVACRVSPPEPKKLATWLVRFSFDGKQDFFVADVREYGDALGDAGLAAYRLEIDRRFAAAPDDHSLRYAAQRLALVDRDPHAVVRLFGGNQSSVYHCAEVAQAMLEIDRTDEALDWARRGMALPATWQSRALYDLAAAVHAQRSETAEAIAVRRAGLVALPDVRSYGALRKAAGPMWHAHRTDALAAVAAHSVRDHVQALLSDGDVDGAWAVATEARVEIDRGTMTQVARRRAKTHPADALPYFRGFAVQALAVSDRVAYRECVRWLKELLRLHETIGTEQEFTEFMAQLREDNRRRPAFLDELRRARLA
jgi:uncharacterized Zn finger protein